MQNLFYMKVLIPKKEMKQTNKIAKTLHSLPNSLTLLVLRSASMIVFSLSCCSCLHCVTLEAPLQARERPFIVPQMPWGLQVCIYHNGISYIYKYHYGFLWNIRGY